MKKFVLFASAALISASSFAQSTDPRPVFPVTTLETETPVTVPNNGGVMKGTGLTDTLYYVPYNNLRTGPYTNYVADYATPYDSGRLNGINVYGNKGYAMLYNGNLDASAPADTTIQVIGIVSRWGGRAANASKSAIFSMWKRDTNKQAVAGRPKFYLYGLPLSATVATKSVPLNQLVLNGKTLDSGNTFTYFTTPVSGVNYSFYVGATISYTWAGAAGDTVGLSTVASTAGGSYVLEATTNDTLISAYSIVQNAAGAWKSNFDNTYSTGGNMVIYPMIKISCPLCGLSARGFNANNLTFYGNYPNPATNNTTVKFALKNRADVSISVMDAAGRTVQVVKESGLTSGVHTMNIDVTKLAAGTYVYLVRTSEGDGTASQFTVSK